MGAKATTFMVSASWLTLLTASPVLAADLNLDQRWQDAAAPMTGGLPAVSGLNGKLLLYGGSYDGDGTVIGEGSLSMPVGHAFGLQIDAALGSRDSDTIGHVGGHFFWRDPAVGLLGVYASYNSIGGDRFNRFALEGQRYIDTWSFEGFAGWDDGEQKDAFFGIAEVAKYLTDDFRVSFGVAYSDWASGSYSGPGLIGTAGFEWQTNWLGPEHAQTIFAVAHVGDNYTTVLGGLKIYLGTEPKSLIRRHREDDPPMVDAGANHATPVTTTSGDT